MSYLMPVGMVYDGSNSVDSVTFVHADHTAAEPHFTIIDRKAPVTKGATTSFAQYRCRTFRGLIDPVSGALKKSVVETTMRWPSFADVSDISEDVETNANITGDADFQASVEAFLLPRAAAVA